MISIVDYGLGNVLAFVNVYKRLNIDVKVASTVDDLMHSSKLILPGVGDFDHAMNLLNQSGLRETLDDLVLNKKVPVIGVCVGMQILANSSDEGTLPGLGWISGQVRSFKIMQENSQKLPLPHMGWNDVKPITSNGLFKTLENDAIFYFLHSYYFVCNDQRNHIAISNYGFEFCCAVNAGNIFGVQFHPEKSHHFGAQLLKNFSEL